MIDKKEMLMKVASYDKTACVLSDVVLAYRDMMAKKAEAEVVPSNKETKTASVKSIVDGVLTKTVDKKAAIINLLNKAISK